MRERMSYIVEIGNCLVSSEIITEYFACDYQACHGCCCIIGDSGAPMEDGEEKLFEQEYEIHSMYHTCLCIILATLEMQRFSLNGVSCCMGYGDFPINI